MAISDQINFRPSFGTQTVPCQGEVGDIFVSTRLDERETDRTAGIAMVWFCIKANVGERPAVWAKVHFDSATTCKDGPVSDPSPLPPPPREG